MYSGVTKTYASNGSILADHAWVWGFVYWPKEGGIGSSRSGRLNALMSTTSNSASVRFFAICNLIDPLGNRFAVAASRVLPRIIATLIMACLLLINQYSLQGDLKEPLFI